MARTSKNVAFTDAQVKAISKIVAEVLKAQEAPKPTTKSSKPVSKKSNGRTKTTKSSDGTFDRKKYDKAVAEYGVETRNGGCYRFCRPMFVAFAKGEITAKELDKQFKAVDKPDWFEED